MHAINRRRFIGSLAAAPLLANYHQLTAAEKGKVKISDIKVMAVQGPRTYNLVKVETDAGIFGIGEAYGSPGAGVKEQVMALKPEMVGKDPLEIEKLTTIYSRTDGSAHSLMRSLERHRGCTVGPGGKDTRCAGDDPSGRRVSGPGEGIRSLPSQGYARQGFLP